MIGESLCSLVDCRGLAQQLLRLQGTCWGQQETVQLVSVPNSYIVALVSAI